MLGRPHRNKGQSTVEYLLMVVFGALFSLQVVRFFNGVFQDGLSRLEGNIQSEIETGKEFAR